jgi:hypothetical protein
MKKLTFFSLFIAASFGFNSCELIPDGLEDVRVSDVKNIGNDTLLVGTSYGLFGSTNGGAAWNLLSSELGAVNINNIDVSEGGRIALATSEGIHYSDNYGQGWQSLLTGKVAENINTAIIVAPYASTVASSNAPAVSMSFLYAALGNSMSLAAQNSAAVQ